jgi:hypothetical protein
MSVDITASPRTRFSPISWPAIFASMAVGLAVLLLLSLAGLAAGIFVADGGEGADTMTIAAAAWSAGSMLFAAIVGGYVAARSSGFRRTGDGALHGAVSWGATTLLYAVLATTALGSLTTGLFSAIAPGIMGNVAPEQIASAATGDRNQSMRVLTDAGLSDDQARTIVDRMAALKGDASAPPAARQQVRDVADLAASATAWLCGTLLLSLILGMLGGMMGARGGRRVNRHRTTITESEAAALRERGAYSRA